jgi:hypothetical protein
MSDQQPPADELHAIRAQIKTLGEREAELRRLMIADPSARTGNQYVVELLEVETRRTDLKELRAMHEDLVEEYTFPQKVVRIELRGVDEDGVVTRIKRGAA